jgi:hypothetical protein
MLGFAGSLHIHPHVVDTEAVRIRYGHTIDVEVPLAAIASVSSGTRSPKGSSRAVQYEDGRLFVAVSGQANVHLDLREPVAFHLPGGIYAVTALSCWADDPASMVLRVRQCVR